MGEQLLSLPDSLEATRIGAGVQGRQQGCPRAGVRAPGLDPAISNLDHEFVDFPHRETGGGAGHELAHQGVPMLGGPPAGPGVAKERSPG